MKNIGRPPHTFGLRTQPIEEREPNKIYNIAYVGEGKSEYIYFNGIRDLAVERGIKYIYLDEIKDSKNENKSHPKHLIELLIEYSKENEACDNEDGYSKTYDERWIVCDRDKQNFSEEQYKELLEKCSENTIYLAMSNPTFELWLLLHLIELDESKLDLYLDNLRKDESGKKTPDRFLVREIRRLTGGYVKGKINFNLYKGGLKDAVNRAEKLTEDNNELIDKLGTSVSVMIKSVFGEKLNIL